MAHVAILIVSHSQRLGDGLVELLEQLTLGKVHVASASGMEGKLGTNPLYVAEAMEACPEDNQIAVLCDVGSSILSFETACELLQNFDRKRVRIVDAPLVEGAIAAAVEASLDGDLDSVVQAGMRAHDLRKLSQ